MQQIQSKAHTKISFLFSKGKKKCAQLGAIQCFSCQLTLQFKISAIIKPCLKSVQCAPNFRVKWTESKVKQSMLIALCVSHSGIRNLREKRRLLCDTAWDNFDKIQSNTTKSYQITSISLEIICLTGSVQAAAGCCRLLFVYPLRCACVRLSTNVTCVLSSSSVVCHVFIERISVEIAFVSLSEIGWRYLSSNKPKTKQKKKNHRVLSRVHCTQHTSLLYLWVLNCQSHHCHFSKND